MVEFDTLDETVDAKTLQRPSDYIGTVVDRAFRLCTAANAKAIFVDSDTVAAAAMQRVRSRVGILTPKRTAAEYRGPEELISLKGFGGPVAYHEILWGNARFAVSSPFVTKQSVKPTEPVAAPPLPTREQAKTTPWTRGMVVTLQDRFGFIKADSTGEDFWFNSTCLFRESLAADLRDRVWFVPSDPVGTGRRRTAKDIIPLGKTLEGKVDFVDPKGFGFALCANERGEAKQIFVFFGSDSGAWTRGTPVTFTVAENPKGIAGENPRVPSSQTSQA